MSIPITTLLKPARLAQLEVTAGSTGTFRLIQADLETVTRGFSPSATF